MIRKLLSLFAIILISIIIASLYGILNDQLTYTISNEYYTKFKFIQFGLVSEDAEYSIFKPRILVTITGIIATWWIGLITGLILGLISYLTQSKWQSMFRLYFKTILIIFAVTFALGMIGLGLAFLFPNENFALNQYPNLTQPKHFYAVGS